MISWISASALRAGGLCSSTRAPARSWRGRIGPDSGLGPMPEVVSYQAVNFERLPRFGLPRCARELAGSSACHRGRACRRLPPLRHHAEPVVTLTEPHSTISGSTARLLVRPTSIVCTWSRRSVPSSTKCVRNIVVATPRSSSRLSSPSMPGALLE